MFVIVVSEIWLLLWFIRETNFRETNLKFYPLFYNHTIIIFISLRFESFNDKYLKIPYSHFI